MKSIFELFSREAFERRVLDGYVRVQSHPSLPLFIANYSEKAQYEKAWDAVTLHCRGLIYDDNFNIVARPYKKFFNYGEGRLKIDDEMPVEVTDKMDGSLGILYSSASPDTESGVNYQIATRGSFASDQAIHATRLWIDKYASTTFPPSDYTFLFEIIYPRNRIVLDYGDMDDLVLLGAVHKERGYYLGPTEAAGILGWFGPVTQVFPYRNIAEAFSADPRPNAEGFVVRSGTEIVKIKQVDYIELHRIVTNLTPLALWRRLAAGESFDDLVEYIPDEWHEWLRNEYKILTEAYAEVEARVLQSYLAVLSVLGESPTRKAFAKKVVQMPDKAYMFALLDMKPIDQMIWAEIRPSGDLARPEY